MTTDKPPYWSHPEGKPGTWARVLCCGGCYQPMSAGYGIVAGKPPHKCICQNPNCDQMNSAFDIPKDEGTP